jgi:hypothetical protein
MGLNPKTRIGEIGATDSNSFEREVKPAFGVEQCGRMGDDENGSSHDEAGRGLEDEEPEESEDAPDATNSESTMNFVA